MAAAMNVAYGVAFADKMSDDEWGVFSKEMQSFSLNEEQSKFVVDRFKSMDILEAINILRYADEGTRDEAQALTMITIMADGDLSDKELGALKLMSDLCRFKEMTVEEAHRILGF